MTLAGKKYLIGALFLSLAVAVGAMVSCSPAGRSSSSGRTPIFGRGGRTATERQAADEGFPGDARGRATVLSGIDSLSDAGAGYVEAFRDPPDPAADSIASADSLGRVDGGEPTDLEILENPDVVEQTGGLVITGDTVRSAVRDRPFLEAPVLGKVRDSLVYDVRRRLIFHYGQGDLTYENNNLKADHIILNAATKEIYGVGMPDTAGVMSRPEFVQGGANYTMDTITYNLDSQKAKIKGVATKDGEGFLLGRDLKKMPDNVVNIAHAKYTTCDNIEHPHFYIAMTKAKVIPGKKIITGPAYFVMEDVPIYFLGIPGGFFPISTGPQSGFVMPQYGEEATRGFYLRNGGYYFTFGDYADLRLTGDLYTLGSWGLNAQSAYVKRYKFTGSLSASYNRVILGEKNSTDYRNDGSFAVKWTHSQDPKANPRQNFSASVDFSTAGQKKLATTSLNDHMNTNTSSSISYSRNWSVGTTTVNMTAAFNLSTRSQDSTLSVTLPNVSLSVSSFAPFKRKVQVGSQRWYEKITMSYSMQAQNQTGPNTKESDIFSKKTLQEMQNGVRHTIPIKTSFNILGYINFSPSFNYSEVWNFKRQRRVWDPDMGQNGAVVELEPEFGFFRTYGWDVGGSLSTKIYGMFEVRRKPGKTGWLQAIRHVVTPTVGFTYAPDFRNPRYGFVDYVQNSKSGTYTSYNPNIGSPTMSAGMPRASVNFSVANQLEIKVKSRRDSTGLKKIPVIEQFSLSGSYNFLAPGDSMQLSNISIQLRTGQIFKNFAIQLNGTWDPYQYVNVGGQARRIGKFNIGGGKFGRITSTGWSFGYTFNSSDSSQPVMNDITSGSFVGAYVNPYDHSLDLDPVTRRRYMVSSYYDFSIPWNFGFNYSVNYSHTALKPTITQTLGFNGSVTLTEKWGVTFTGGFDIARRKFTPMQVNLARDLHCWEMAFQWIPMGYMKSYSFHIGIKSGMLADIKYDKGSSMYDNLVR